MPLGYDPKAKRDHWEPVGGEYGFTVLEANEEVMKSGLGLKVKLSVDAGPGDQWCWERFAYLDEWLFRLEEFCQSIGVPFDPAPEAADMVQRKGRGRFFVDEYQGKKRLKVIIEGGFIPKPASSAPNHDYGPPPMNSGDVPF